MAIKKEILDELPKDKDPKTMFFSDGLFGELKKALAERVLNAEMDQEPIPRPRNVRWGIDGAGPTGETERPGQDATRLTVAKERMPRTTDTNFSRPRTRNALALGNLCRRSPKSAPGLYDRVSLSIALIRLIGFNDVDGLS